VKRVKNDDYTAAIAAVEKWRVNRSTENSTALRDALEKTRGTWIQVDDIRYRWLENGVHMETVS
jgi:hypothetical protein